ncbi:XdhC family protein [Stenotrophomonas maltophilia]|uniref:XdhC family protein n=1 Tax=Stenotrophomonas maltophilia TaxID=40324 RepID=UPI0007EFDAD4|nr:XdhC/CoxI family protein [Stenotrophomonas maltophilia]OBU48846.1 XshC-Cox1-family protein [Stenotrophomonas maltophilia]
MDQPEASATLEASAIGGGGPRDAAGQLSAAPGFLTEGSPRSVLETALTRARAGDHAVLALVLETDGSTYAGAGDMVLFCNGSQVGWLSGGCLEPELARRAEQVSAAGQVDWIEIDTRSDEDLLSGSALGCRGRLRIALLPLRAMAGIDVVIEAWLREGVPLQRELRASGQIVFRAGRRERTWQLHPMDGTQPFGEGAWRLTLPRLPRALILGGGPETPFLVPLLRGLGWQISVAERRARWASAGQGADAQLQTSPAEALHGDPCDAVLVMHHDFELDREALVALADTKVAFIGLLGPQRRREDLFKLLTPDQRHRLSPRLRSPVGLKIGGRGPEAISLSIAAQLQQWRSAHGR